MTDIPLYILSCPTCGIVFAITKSFQALRLSDHKDFYCPNQHEIHYPGESHEDRANRLQESADRERRFSGAAYRDCRTLRRTTAALRGVITRARNKAAKKGAKH